VRLIAYGAFRNYSNGPDSIIVTKLRLNSDRNGSRLWVQELQMSTGTLALAFWQRRGTFTDDTTMSRDSRPYCLEMGYSVQNEPPTDTACEYNYPQQRSCTASGVDIYTTAQHCCWGRVFYPILRISHRGPCSRVTLVSARVGA